MLTFVRSILVGLFLLAPGFSNLDATTTHDITAFEPFQKTCLPFIKVALSGATTEIKGLSSLSLRVFGKRLENRIIDRCSKVSCTFENVSGIIEQELQRFKTMNRRLSGVTILGLVGATLTAISYVSLKFASSSPVLAQVGGYLAAYGFLKILSPFNKPLHAWGEKLVFRILGYSNQPVLARSDPGLSRIWYSMMGTYDINNQMARGLVNAVVMNTREIAEATLLFASRTEVSREDSDEYILDNMAELMIRLDRLYSDFPADDPSLRLTIQSSFINALKRINRYPENFVDRLRARIQDLNSEMSPASIQKYDRLIKTFFGA